MGQFAALGGMSTLAFRCRGGLARASQGRRRHGGDRRLRRLRRDLRLLARDRRDDGTDRAAGTQAPRLFRRPGDRHAGGRRHARHPDPAIVDPGDLRDPHRAEHRQAVPRRDRAGHSRRGRLHHHDRDRGAACSPRSAGTPYPRVPYAERFKQLARIWPVLLIFVLVIGGIYSGVFTPTEAAAVGAVGTGIIAVRSTAA